MKSKKEIRKKIKVNSRQSKYNELSDKKISDNLSKMGLRGGIIGAIIGVILEIFFYYNNPEGSYFQINCLGGNYCPTSYINMINNFYSWFGLVKNIYFMLVLEIIGYAILGFIIGWIIGSFIAVIYYSFKYTSEGLDPSKVRKK